MSKVYTLLFAAIFMLCITGNAQVSVTATAGTTGPTSYTTLKAAFDAINAGTHKGAITVAISGNTTEAEPLQSMPMRHRQLYSHYCNIIRSICHYLQYCHTTDQPQWSYQCNNRWNKRFAAGEYQYHRKCHQL